MAVPSTGLRQAQPERYLIAGLISARGRVAGLPSACTRFAVTNGKAHRTQHDCCAKQQRGQVPCPHIGRQPGHWLYPACQERRLSGVCPRSYPPAVVDVGAAGRIGHPEQRASALQGAHAGDGEALGNAGAAFEPCHVAWIDEDGGVARARARKGP